MSFLENAGIMWKDGRLINNFLKNICYGIFIIWEIC